MNKEEKEAIAFLRRDIKFRKNNKWFENCIIEPKTAQILLNYIDKLQKQLDQLKEVDRQICNEELITKDKYQDILKENEELKVEIKKQYKQYIKDHTEVIENLKKDSISKDIIENKIKELGSIKGDLATYIAVTEKIKVLEELLGE